MKKTLRVWGWKKVIEQVKLRAPHNTLFYQELEDSIADLNDTDSSGLQLFGPEEVDLIELICKELQIDEDSLGDTFQLPVTRKEGL